MDELEKAKSILWKYALLSVAVLLLVVSVAQAYQIAGMGKAENTVNTANTGALDTSGWTADEKMNYEMHGVIPARVKGGAASSGAAAGAGMVGGC